MTPDDIARARKLASSRRSRTRSARWWGRRRAGGVGWSQPWHAFDAKQRDPECPSTGRLVQELGDTLLDALEHAISTDGDHLSIAYRLAAQLDTVMHDREALRQRVHDLEKAIDGVLGESDPYIETLNFRALRTARTAMRTK